MALLDLTGPNFDLSTSRDRNKLWTTLLKLAGRAQRHSGEIEQALDSAARVRPVPLGAFPMAAGQIYTGQESGNVGDLVYRAHVGASTALAPPGFVICNGASLDTTQYADLFAQIGYSFGGSGSNFNVPDLVGKFPRGSATSGTGGTGGAATDSITLAEANLPPHSHVITDPGHTHGNSGLGVECRNGTGVLGDPARPLLASQPDPATATVVNGAISGSSSSSLTGISANNTGSGTPFDVDTVPPYVDAGTWYIRYALGPADTIATLPISWGPVNAQWKLDLARNFAAPKHELKHETTDKTLPEATVHVTSATGSGSGSASDIEIVGVYEVPYNFRRWRTDAITIKVKANDSCPMTLKISDPVNAGSFVASTALTADGTWQKIKITADQLGPDWKPGYLFRFVLEFAYPLTYANALMAVGRLELSWT